VTFGDPPWGAEPGSPAGSQRPHTSVDACGRLWTVSPGEPVTYGRVWTPVDVRRPHDAQGGRGFNSLTAHSFLLVRGYSRFAWMVLRAVGEPNGEPPRVLGGLAPGPKTHTDTHRHQRTVHCGPQRHHDGPHCESARVTPESVPTSRAGHPRTGGRGRLVSSLARAGCRSGKALRGYRAPGLFGVGESVRMMRGCRDVSGFADIWT
jgi:hypothetical protein